MSLKLVVRRYTDGVPEDITTNYEDSATRLFGYSLDDGLLKIMEVELNTDPDRWRKVNLLVTFSNEGFIEVSGTRMAGESGITQEDMNASVRKFSSSEDDPDWGKN